MTGRSCREGKTAFVGATLLPVSGPPVYDGGLLIRDAKIAAVGRDVGPDSADAVFDCRGLMIAPGLIDCHCHVGIVPEELDWEFSDVNEDTDPATPYVNVRDGIDFEDAGFQQAPVRIHSMTPADFRSILRIKEEFGIDITIEHGDEAPLMADELAEAAVPVRTGPLWVIAGHGPGATRVPMRPC